MNKKAQAQIITTVLIILLVLAAIVIIWVVINNVIKGGAEQIEKQSTCFGISMEVTAISATEVIVKRMGGNSLTGTNITYIKNGISQTTFPELDKGTGVEPFNEPMASKKLTGLLLGDEVEIALKLSDGTVCPISGKDTTRVF